MAIGPLSRTMLQHMVLMNILVPAAMLSLRAWQPGSFAAPVGQPSADLLSAGPGATTARAAARSWPLATALQLTLLWAWHAPPAFAAAMTHPWIMAAMHVTLTAAALWFWLALVAMPDTHRWRSIIALLVTGKLFCLLGALLAFAPRPLYAVLQSAQPALTTGSMSIALADQQLAGIIMLTVCPLVYVFAGITISARWFYALERNGRADRLTPRIPTAHSA